jgi:hypothetical protein
MNTTNTDGAAGGLLPCPFCGGQAQMIEGDGGFSGRVQIDCTVCRNATWWWGEAVAIRQWNRRATASAQATVPAGWKLVPIEPTESMVIDGFESAPSALFSEPEVWGAFEAMSGCQQAAHKARLCYAAMLTAAPAAPQASDRCYAPSCGQWDGTQTCTCQNAASQASESVRMDAEPRTLDEYHEDYGNVVWWCWQDGEWLGEPAWIGKPHDSDWPDYHTHWTPHPAFPAAIAAAQPASGGKHETR